jgi:hypothetical protein
MSYPCSRTPIVRSFLFPARNNRTQFDVPVLPQGSGHSFLKSIAWHVQQDGMAIASWHLEAQLIQSDPDNRRSEIHSTDAASPPGWSTRGHVTYARRRRVNTKRAKHQTAHFCDKRGKNTKVFHEFTFFATVPRIINR